MPVPQGQITSSEGWNTPQVEEPKEEVVAEEKPKRKKKVAEQDGAE